MSYEPTTWVTGDIITATKLNNIESGVQSVSSSYTPTTWATGDIITALKLNNIEQGIANASGGSSDFSTAEVTVINTTYDNISFNNCCNVIDTTEFQGIVSPIEVEAEQSITVIVPLYKGRAVWEPSYNEYPDTGVTAVSGDIDNDYGTLYITGDGTITLGITV